MEKKEKTFINHLSVYEEALIIVDMVNGFAREGVLASPLVEKIITNDGTVRISIF